MRKAAIGLGIAALLAGAVLTGSAIATNETQAAPTLVKPQTWKGRTAWEWAMRARSNKRDSNLRGRTILRLKQTLTHRASIREAVALASIAYPALTPHRAWCVIRHESWDGTEASLVDGKPARARNRQSVWNGEHATGLWQMLPSTFARTPFGAAGLSIYSPYATSLAAGWLHAHHGSSNWQIRC